MLLTWGMYGGFKLKPFINTFLPLPSFWNTWCISKHLSGLPELTRSDIESFVTIAGKRLKSCNTATCRIPTSFLPTASCRWEVKSALVLIPKLIHHASTGWKNSRVLFPGRLFFALLSSIDQENPIGLRDYTIFFLIVSYGLRSSDIVALNPSTTSTGEGEKSRYLERKTGNPLILPLMDTVGSVLLQYLRKGRPPLPYRQIFLRAQSSRWSPKAHSRIQSISSLVETKRVRNSLSRPSLPSALPLA